MTEVSNQTLHEILLRVEAKVDKTNGRVLKLEEFKSIAKGMLIVVNVLLVGLVIPLTFSYFNNADRTAKAVDTIMGKYLEVE